MRLRVLAAAGLFMLAACGIGAPRSERKLVILGFDGLDYDLTDRWITTGVLPNLAALAAEGGLSRLETTPTVDTAQAWTSWATGVNAGTHGVFDEVMRGGESALVEPTPHRQIFGRWTINGPGFRSRRRAPSFWTTAADAGVRASVLAVPGAFPPEDLPGGELLSGFPLPAIDDTAGTYGFYASELRELDPALAPFRAHRQPLLFANRVARAELPGPRRPLAQPVPFTVTWNHEARTANVEISGDTLHMAEGQWSKWVALPFHTNPLVRAQGMVQFYLHRAGVELQLYASPIQWHPSEPPSPISSPSGFSADLYERLGPYRTLSRPGTAWALANGDIEEQVFLDDLDRAFDDRAALILNRVEQARWDLLIGVVEATDDVQHVMWRLIDPLHPAYDPDLANLYGGSIQRIYRRADALVGQVRARLPRGAALVVLSTHGFRPFRASVDLNTWLAERGYLKRASGRDFPATIDWRHTRAYALGAGHIYINRQDRGRPDTPGERGTAVSGTAVRGTVTPEEYDALVSKLKTELASLIDLSTGRRVIARVETRHDVYPGRHTGESPDLVVGFARGYRASWPTTFGLPPGPVIALNRGIWSGDHASMDRADTPGVFVSNLKPLEGPKRLIDVAPTVLKYFGLAIPASLEGRPIF